MSKASKNNGTVIITGGAQRIGKVIALHLAKSGFNIALHYHQSKKEAQRLATTIQKFNVDCHLFSSDLSQTDQVKELYKNIHKKCPKIQLLINNASVFKKDSFKKESLDCFDTHMNVNLKAPFMLMQKFYENHKSGHIINILDTHITKNTSHYATYLLSKKALADLTKMAAVEFAPKIRVNGIAPGVILPQPNSSQNYVKRLLTQVPLNKKGSPINITQSIDFLLQNKYLTGQIIFNDGGEFLL